MNIMASSQQKYFADVSTLVCVLMFFAQSVIAAPTFPSLTGRVVDEAGLFTPGTVQQLTQLSQQHEQKTGNQLVVVTLKSLQGYPIEDFGYQLGRHWGIGQKGKNNGALLIIAPADRAVRIEVGYGLEGQLTDAISHDIIQNRIIPLFRTGDFDRGAIEGLRAMVSALGGEYEISKPFTAGKTPSDPSDAFSPLIMVIAVIGIVLASIIGRIIAAIVVFGGVFFAIFSSTGSVLFGIFMGIFITIFVVAFSFRGFGGGRHYGGFGRGGGFGGGGGFSGGGGSFGGGGASGRW